MEPSSHVHLKLVIISGVCISRANEDRNWYDKQIPGLQMEVRDNVMQKYPKEIDDLYE